MTTHPARTHRAHPGGFSLLELLVVVTIIGLLAALVGPRLLAKAGGTKVTTTKTQIQLLSDSVEQYQLDADRLPSDDEGLSVLIKPIGEGDEQKKPVLGRATLPKDGWGRDFMYKTDDTWDFIIYSYGADGRPGGEDENADLNNRDLSEIP